MELNCGTFDVVYKQKSVGEARIIRIGIRYELSAVVKYLDISGPFRVAAVSGEKVVPLGVMMPKGDGFEYRRSFSTNDLKNIGIDDISGFTIAGDESSKVHIDTNNHEDNEWKVTNEPWQYLEEGEFRHVFSACNEALVSTNEEFVRIAVPIVKNEPFPLMPIFCLGEIQKINENLHLVFKLHEGKLLF